MQRTTVGMAVWPSHRHTSATRGATVTKSSRSNWSMDAVWHQSKFGEGRHGEGRVQEIGRDAAESQVSKLQASGQSLPCIQFGIAGTQTGLPS
jgi:hypothetical protein